MKNRIERIDYFRERVKVANKDGNRPSLKIPFWRGKPITLKVIDADIDYLMYRIENSRTEIQQLAYLRKNPHLGKKFFDDPESETVQNAQENILSEINKEKGGKDFFNDLSRGQEEPVIITFDGFIVNGNRRTAALKFLHKRYIDCVVLHEDATVKDLYELEQVLQMSQEFKLPYHWINELRNIKRGLDDKRFKYGKPELANHLRIDIKELDNKIATYDLIEGFLVWKNIPGQFDYPKLDDAEQSFKELVKAQKKIKDPFMFSECRNSVFMLIEERPQNGRVYSFITYLISNFEQIYVSLNKNNKERPKEKTKSKSPKSIVDDVLDENKGIKNQLFSDSSQAIEISKILQEEIQNVKALTKEKDDAEAAYNSISDALRELSGLNLDSNCARIKDMKNKLIAIKKITDDLLIQVNKLI